MTRLRVLHLITHLAVGGATEPTITTCQYLDPARFEAVILSGTTEAGQGTMRPQADAAGVQVHTLATLRRPIRPRADRIAYRDLIAWLLYTSPWDVVHTHGSKAGLLGRLAAKKAGVPIIIHNVHGWGHHGHMNPSARRLYILAERRAAKVTDLFVTDAAANIGKGLKDGIGRPEQYVTVYNGIDIARFRDVQADRDALRTALRLPLDAPVVGTVGRMAKQKGPGDFVRMAELVLQVRPETHFVWVGGGPLEKPLQAKVQKMGLANRVHLLGYRHDVPELLRVFDVFVLSSLWEGLPRVFAQAMCAGLPIVATHVDGAAEAVAEGENGFLVPPKQPGALAVQVLALLGDRERAHAMGANGLARVDRQFNERHMVEQIADIYLSLARQKGLLTETSDMETSDTPQEAALR